MNHRAFARTPRMVDSHFNDNYARFPFALTTRGDPKDALDGRLSLSWHPPTSSSFSPAAPLYTRSISFFEVPGYSVEINSELLASCFHIAINALETLRGFSNKPVSPDLEYFSIKCKILTLCCLMYLKLFIILHNIPFSSIIIFNLKMWSTSLQFKIHWLNFGSEKTFIKLSWRESIKKNPFQSPQAVSL